MDGTNQAKRKSGRGCCWSGTVYKCVQMKRGKSRSLSCVFYKHYGGFWWMWQNMSQRDHLFFVDLCFYIMFNLQIWWKLMKYSPQHTDPLECQELKVHFSSHRIQWKVNVTTFHQNFTIRINHSPGRYIPVPWIQWGLGGGKFFTTGVALLRGKGFMEIKKKNMCLFCTNSLPNVDTKIWRPVDMGNNTFFHTPTILELVSVEHCCLSGKRCCLGAGAKFNRWWSRCPFKDGTLNSIWVNHSEVIWHHPNTPPNYPRFREVEGLRKKKYNAPSFHVGCPVLFRKTLRRHACSEKFPPSIRRFQAQGHSYVKNLHRKAEFLGLCGLLWHQQSLLPHWMANFFTGYGSKWGPPNRNHEDWRRNMKKHLPTPCPNKKFLFQKW